MNDAFEAILNDAYTCLDKKKVGRRLLGHLLYCQLLSYYASLSPVPISHTLIRPLAGMSTAGSTRPYWQPLVDIDAIDFRDYAESKGRSRRFWLTWETRQDLQYVLLTASPEEKVYCLTSSSTRPVRSGMRTSMRYTDESGESQSWKRKSTIMYKTLKAYKGTRDVFNKEGVLAHLSRLKATHEEKKARYEEARDDDADRLTLQRLRREYSAARDRLRSDMYVWTTVKGQHPKHVEGPVYEYVQAYDVQLKSGRLTQRAGFQNASTAMKQAAIRGTGHHNTDIASSQTVALLQLLHEAADSGADVDPTVLETYLDAGGKDNVASRYGIPRELLKPVEHSLKFGATFTHSTVENALIATKYYVKHHTFDAAIQSALGQDASTDEERLGHLTREERLEKMTLKKLPAMSRAAVDIADATDYTREEAYQILREVYGPQVDTIQAWRAYLASPAYLEQKGPDGRHKHISFSRGKVYAKGPCLSIQIDYNRHAQEGQKIKDPRKLGKDIATLLLQGMEARFMHELKLQEGDYSYTLHRNEHDGATASSVIPVKAIEQARGRSGFKRADLVEKAFVKTQDKTKNGT